jgi:hypothetical protein
VDYIVNLADFTSGEVLDETCCVPGPGKFPTAAWARSSGLLDGLLVMEILGSDPVGTLAIKQTLRQFNGGTVSFTSYGLTDAEQESLAQQVILGPQSFSLPAEGWNLVAIGTTNAGQRRTQQFRSPGGQISIATGEYRDEFMQLLISRNPISKVTVAGNDGWMTTSIVDNEVIVVWPIGDSGQWATMRIPAVFADRTNEIIAAVTRADGAPPTQVGEGRPELHGTPESAETCADPARPVGFTVPAALQPGTYRVVASENGTTIHATFEL